MKKLLLFLVGAAMALTTQAQIFSQDFILLPQFVGTTANQFSSANAAGNSSIIADFYNKLVLDRPAGATGFAYFAKTAVNPLPYNPTFISMEFKMKATAPAIANGQTAVATMYVGSNFGDNENPQGNAHSLFQVDFDTNGAGRISNPGGSATAYSAAERTFFWVINQTGMDQTGSSGYTGPDGNKHDLLNNQWALWVDGTLAFGNQVKSNLLPPSTATDLSNFKFVFDNGVGTIEFDDFSIQNQATSQTAFTQNFTALVSYYTDPTSGIAENGRFDYIGPAGYALLTNGYLYFYRINGITSGFARTMPLAGNNGDFMYMSFGLTFTINGPQADAARLQVGDNYTADNTIEPANKTAQTLQIDFVDATHYKLRDPVNNIDLTGNLLAPLITVPIVWVMNRTGALQSYRGPDYDPQMDNKSDIADKSADLWIGTTRVIQDVSISDVAFSDFKFTLTQGSSTISFDNLLIQNLSQNLPVSLTSFTGKALNHAVQLNWATVSEKNNSHFEIQRSADGKSFETIGSVKGNNNSDQKQEYTFRDENPLAGAGYYQLKQVDLDGKFSKSSIVAVSMPTEKSSMKVFVASNEQIDLSVYSANATSGQVILLDLNGRQLLKQGVTLSKGYNILHVPVQNLQEGIHIATLYTPTETLSQKFIK